MAHASESQHWYTAAGEPAYTVKARDGSDRPATLRDARKIGLVPSVTSIIRCAAAPGLERWKQEQVLLAALTLSRKDGEDEKAYLARILEDSREQAINAAARGTAIHAAIQGHYEGVAPTEEFWPHVRGAKDAITEFGAMCKVGVDGTWYAERSFSHPLGFGGKVDLHCDVALLDVKTKEFGPDDDLKTWDEHAMQLAAYREGLRLKARGAICYVSVTHPGLARIIEIPEETLAAGWEMFKGLLCYWQAKNKYRPVMEKVAA